VSNYLLQLSLGTESIDFINDSGNQYYLLDGTFSAPPPSVVETRSGVMRGGGERILSRKYKNRIVSFSFMVKGATVNAIVDAVVAVQRLLERASSGKTITGGTYSVGSTYEDGYEVGESGPLLRVQLRNTAGEDRLTFRIVSGTVEIPNYYGVGGIGSMVSGNLAIEEVRVELECEPFAMGAPVALAAASTVIYGPKQDSSTYNPAHVAFYKISASEVKGDVPAAIKHVNKNHAGSVTGYDGAIIARESGNGVLSCPSYPVTYGTGLSDFFVVGGNDRSSIKEYDVQITATGTFKWSIDDGASFPTTGVTISASGNQLGVGGPIVMFGATTGYTAGRGWKFRNDQFYITVDATNTGVNLSGINGTPVATFYVNVTYGHSGRYRVIAYTGGSTADMEWCMAPGFTEAMGVGGSSGQKQPWVLGGTSNCFLGVLDLSADANRAARYPGAHSIATATIYARNRSGSVSSNANVEYVLLVPVESDDSYFVYTYGYPSVTVIESERVVLCNYDARNPVMGISGDNTLPYKSYLPVTGTFVGGIPYLEPNVEQSLYYVPVIGNSGLAGYPAQTAAIIDAVTFECRPRYLVVG